MQKKDEAKLLPDDVVYSDSLVMISQYNTIKGMVQFIFALPDIKSEFGVLEPWAALP